MLHIFAKIFGRKATKRIPKARQRQLVRLWVEELTPRVLPSASPMSALWGHCSGGGFASSADPSSSTALQSPGQWTAHCSG